jgi:hypothetical protein
MAESSKSSTPPQTNDDSYGDDFLFIEVQPRSSAPRSKVVRAKARRFVTASRTQKWLDEPPEGALKAVPDGGREQIKKQVTRFRLEKDISTIKPVLKALRASM